MTTRFTNPLPQFSDANGDPYSGGSLEFYESGTSTPLATYSDDALTTPNPNPLNLDSAGRPANPVFLQSQDYKVVLKDSGGGTVWTQDPVRGGRPAQGITYKGDFTGASTVGLRDHLDRIVITPEQFGVVKNSRSDASANTANMQAAIDAAVANDVPLYLGYGDIFFDDELDVSRVVMSGAGTAYWNQRSIAFSSVSRFERARTTLIYTGGTATTRKIYGISSLKSCGGRRQLNATDQKSYLEGNGENYDLVSLMNDDATDNGTTSVASVFDARCALVNLSGSNTVLRDFRLMVDGEGDDGLDWYQDSTRGDLLDKADIGVFQNGGRECQLDNVQIVGPWRKYGWLVCSVLQRNYSYSNGYLEPYDTLARNCRFEGMRGFGRRGMDKFKILNSTSTYVEVRWADDHPFTLDTNVNLFRLANLGVGVSLGDTYFYTTVEYIDNGGGDIRARLGGLQDGQGNNVSFSDGGYDAIISQNAGGADSHVTLQNSTIGGLHVPNGYAPNDTVNVTNRVTNAAIGGFESSGYRGAELMIDHCRVQHQNTLTMFLHEGRDFYIRTFQAEHNRDSRDEEGGVAIVSPAPLAPSADTDQAGGTRYVLLDVPLQIYNTNPGTYLRPFYPVYEQPARFANQSPGWCDPGEGIASLHHQHNSAVDTNGPFTQLPRVVIGPDTEGINSDKNRTPGGGNTNIGAELTFNAGLFQLPGVLMPAVERTISSGAISVGGVGNIKVDTEGNAASDDLVRVDDGIEGQVVVLRAENGSRTVTVKDISAGGTANVELGGSDFTLDNARNTLTLLYDGAVWVPMGGKSSV